jgi:hypothetical protein
LHSPTEPVIVLAMNNVFKNMTPHNVVVRRNNEEFHFEPCGVVPRVATVATPDGYLDGFPVNKVSFGEVENLPEPEDNVVLIVSAMVRQAVPHRRDVVSPDTGPSAIRNEKGHILAVRGFVR